MHSRYSLTDFEFLDDNFAGDAGRLRELMRALRTRGYRWGCQLTVKALARDLSLIDDMHVAGCASMFLGIETGDPDLLQRVKGTTVDDTNKVIRRLLDVGIRAHAGFIMGHPWDTEGTISRTTAMVRELRAQGVMCSVSLLTPFPGSPVAEDPGRFGVTIHCQDPEYYTFSRPVISTRHLTRERLANLYAGLLIDMASEDAHDVQA